MPLADSNAHGVQNSSSAASFRTVIRIGSRDQVQASTMPPPIVNSDELVNEHPHGNLESQEEATQSSAYTYPAPPVKDTRSSDSQKESRIPLSRQSSTRRFSHPDPYQSALRLLDFIRSSESTLRLVENSIGGRSRKRRSMGSDPTDRRPRDADEEDTGLQNGVPTTSAKNALKDPTLQRAMRELGSLLSEAASVATDILSTQTEGSTTMPDLTGTVGAIGGSALTGVVDDGPTTPTRSHQATAHYHSRPRSLPVYLRYPPRGTARTSETDSGHTKGRSENELSEYGRDFWTPSSHRCLYPTRAEGSAAQEPGYNTPDKAQEVVRGYSSEISTGGNFINSASPEPAPIPGEDGPSEIQSQAQSGTRLRKRDQSNAYKPIYPTELDLTPRDWSPFRKAFVAAIACCNMAAVSMVVALYSGLVPSIEQPKGLDSGSIDWMLFANVWPFLGMAITALLLWPLPLLQGRKPYISGGLILTLLLLSPQAIALRADRYLTETRWRYTFIITRALMGISLGFVEMNSFSTLTDLYGASLLGRTEDGRSRGGGMGSWLGVWAWCSVGVLAFGFAIGEIIAGDRPLAWGLYVSMLIVAVTLLVNILCPDCRGALYMYRRHGSDSHLPVGEVMIHRINKTPIWWGEEMNHGILLSLEMLRQPGFLAVALYTGWVYGQAILVMMVLASLTSHLYEHPPVYVGCIVLAMTAGPFTAVLFSPGGYFSRGSHALVRSMLKGEGADSVSVFVWRTISITTLLFFMMGYTPASSGPPVSFAWPVILASGIGFLSCLAISDCHVLIMETFDYSDLELDPTTRPQAGRQQPHYSSFPRVSAGIACCHGFGFIFAAGATALGVVADERLFDLQAMVGAVAGVFFLFTVALLVVLVPYKQLELRTPRPGISPNATPETARLSFFEIGPMSRWSEIHNRNRFAQMTQRHNARRRRRAGGVKANDLRAAAAAEGSPDLDPDQWTIQHASHLMISKVRPMETEVASTRVAGISTGDQA